MVTPAFASPPYDFVPSHCSTNSLGPLSVAEWQAIRNHILSTLRLSFCCWVGSLSSRYRNLHRATYGWHRSSNRCTNPNGTGISFQYTTKLAPVVAFVAGGARKVGLSFPTKIPSNVAISAAYPVPKVPNASTVSCGNTCKASLI